MADTYTNKDFCILVVDDEPEFRDGVVSFLESHGFSIITAKNGQEALEIFDKQEVDIAIIDYRMPKMDGEELIARVRDINSETVIILSTAYSGEKPRIDTLQGLDIQAYYDKSEGPEVLLEKVIGARKTSAQIKENRRRFEQVGLANKTIELVRRERDLLIEQERLASVGELNGNIYDNMYNYAFCANVSIDAVIDGLNTLSNAMYNSEYSRDDHRKMIQDTIKSASRTRSRVKDLMDYSAVARNQTLQGKTDSPGNSFTLGEFLRTFSLLMKNSLDKYSCCLNQNILVASDLESIKISGKVEDLVQALSRIVTNSARMVFPVEDGTQSCVDFKVTDIENEVKFDINYAGEEVSQDSLKQIIVAKDKNNVWLGTYTALSLITENFNGKVWVESSNGKVAYFVTVPFKKKIRENV